MRAAEDDLGGAELHQPSEIEDCDPVGDVADDAEVVRDEEIGGAMLRLQLDQQIENRRLDGDVERRGRFVAHDDLRLAGERTRNREPLLQSARELAWLRAHVTLREAHGLHQLEHPRVGSRTRETGELLQRAAQNPAHGVAPVQRRVGILEDDLQRADLGGGTAAEGSVQRFAFERHRAGARRDDPEQRARECRLAASRLADEAECLAWPDRCGDADERMDVVSVLAEDLAEVLEAEQRLRVPVDRRERAIHVFFARQVLRFVVEVAPAHVSAADRVERWLLGVADLARERAPRCEHATRQILAEVREEAGDRVEPAAVLARAAARNAAQQPHGVRVPGLV